MGERRGRTIKDTWTKTMEEGLNVEGGDRSGESNRSKMGTNITKQQ